MPIHRVGTFFMMVGLLLIGLYVISDIAETPVWYLLLSGMVLLGLGVILWFRTPGPTTQPSGRFRLIKSFRNKQGKAGQAAAKQSGPRKG